MKNLAITLLTMVLLCTGLKKCQKNEVRDMDNNIYGTLVIGSQVWMSENLRTTMYNDGSAISLVSDSLKWQALGSPAFCWYRNDSTGRKLYGALYNWRAVQTGRLCPAGWHVPSSDDLRILSDFLGGDSIAGGRLKEKGFTHWMQPNEGADDRAGFRALPGGYRSTEGEYLNRGLKAYFWTSTPSNDNYADDLTLTKDEKIFHRYTNLKNNGFTIRCLKNN